jgi:hypothetical protein
LHEFLWSRFVAATAVATLLRHRATNLWPFRLHGILSVGSQPGSAGSAGRGFIANIDVAIAHDWNPLLKLDDNARLLIKIAVRSVESADQVLRFTAVDLSNRFSTRERLKSRTMPRTRRWWVAQGPQVLFH